MTKRLSLVMTTSIMLFSVSMWFVITQANASIKYDDEKGVVYDISVATKNEETSSSNQTDATTEAQTTPAQTTEDATTVEVTTIPVTEAPTEVETEPMVTEPATELKEAETTTKAKEEKETEKPTKKKKEESTKKTANNTVPSQKDNTSVLGNSDLKIIRNTINSTIWNVNSKVKNNNNMKNLAVYMANNYLSDAGAAADDVCGYNTLQVRAKTTTVTMPSASEGVITEKALEAGSSIAGSINGDFGIGINATFANGKYEIYIVVVYEN